MSSYLTQLTRPGGAGDNTARQQSQQEGLPRYNSGESATSTVRHQSATVGAMTQDKVTTSSLMQWQLNTAAGLKEKEEKLKMSTCLAEIQKTKIEALRKEIEMVSTEVVKRKEENQTLSQSLSSTKEEVEIMSRQVKTVAGQIRRIRGEKEEMAVVEEERKLELGRLVECFDHLKLVQGEKERSWTEELKKVEEEFSSKATKNEQEENEDFRHLKLLEDKMILQAREQLSLEKLVEAADIELKKIEEEKKVAVEKCKLIKEETEKSFKVGANTERCLREELMILRADKAKKQDELTGLSELLIIEKNRNEDIDKATLTAQESALKVETQISKLVMKRKEIEMEEIEIKNQLNVNSKLVETLEIKVVKIEKMKAEIIALDTYLKESEAKRLLAESELEYLRKVEEDRLKLDEENLQLSQRVHLHEAAVLSCKTEVSEAHEKLKSIDIGLLEADVQKMINLKRNKLAEIEKHTHSILSSSEVVSGSKCSSSLLQAQFDTLEAEHVKKVRTVEDKTKTVSNLGEELITQDVLLDSLRVNKGKAEARTAALINEIELLTSSLASKTKISNELEAKKEEVGTEAEKLVALKDRFEADLQKLRNELANDSKKIEVNRKERDQKQLKNSELREMLKKTEAENVKIKKDLQTAEEELTMSDNKMKTSEGIKQALAEKTFDIKKLEKEIKGGKRNSVTVTKRKEKMSKQLEKNTAVSDSLADELVKQEQRIVEAQNSIVVSKGVLIEKSQETQSKQDAKDALNKSIATAADQVAEMKTTVKSSRTRTEVLSSSRSKLISSNSQAVQEFQGLLVCKEREFSDILAKLTAEVAELETKEKTRTHELEKQEMEHTKVDDESATYEDKILSVSKEIEALKDESRKLDQKLQERQGQVVKLKEKVQNVSSGKKPRTPLSQMRSANTTSSLAKPPAASPKATPSYSRQARSLLPSNTPRPVPQSPVRSFLVPPPRPTPSSNHSRPKKKTPPAPIMDFDCVLGVSDDLDSS